MKNKKLISVMLATMIGAGVRTMAGCSDYGYEYNNDEAVGSRKFTDAYIVMESKDKK